MGLVGEGEEKLHSYSKGKGKMPDESLIGLVFSACNSSQLVKEHQDLGSHLNGAIISFSRIPPSISVK